jgi:hypothetical protein
MTFAQLLCITAILVRLLLLLLPWHIQVCLLLLLLLARPC